jgi:hypothetical protein
MMRTTITLPNTLHQRLSLAAKAMNTNFSKALRELADEALQAWESKQLEQTYQCLRDLKGIGGEGITDASTTIDEVLYGEHGAWRGSDE